MMSIQKLGALLVILGTALAGLGCSPSTDSAGPMHSIDEPTPDPNREPIELRTATVSLDTLEGELAAKQDQLVLVHLWATW